MTKPDKSAEAHLPLPPAILKRTDGKLNLGAGALYGSIARMRELVTLADETLGLPDPS